MPKSQNLKKDLANANAYQKNYKKVTAFVQRQPFFSFFIALAALFVIIFLGNLLNRPKPTKSLTNAPKQVQIYAIGQAPKIMLQGKVNKSGIVKITAQSSGIVQNIAVKEGDSVSAGTQLITLSTSYQGGNAPALQAEIAQKQYQNVLDTYGEQTDNINKQKDIARKTEDNATSLQNLNAESATESASLINDDQDYINNLRQTLASSTDPATISQLQATINQLQGGLDQLKANQRQLAYQADGNQPPVQMATIQRDLTLQQLDIQQKSLDFSKEVSQLQSQLADVSAANMTPASPFPGTVQRVFVNVGQNISSGTVLAVIASPNTHTTVEVNVPQNVAQNISRLDASNLHIGTHIYSVKPTFVSSEATTGSLYTILYEIPQDDNMLVTDASYINVEIPVGAPSTGSTVPFVPLDAIYQTQDSSYLMVDDHGTARTKQVTLGQIYGSYAEITNGLKSGDQIILDRNVVAGDKINVIAN